jgi:Uncharacterized conserved protein (DUF2183)
VGDSGESDLELYTEIATKYPRQILGIFIRDVTTPLLSKNSAASTSTHSLPGFFEGNGQPQPLSSIPKNQRLAVKNLRESLRTKSAETVPTISTLQAIVPENLDELTLQEIETIVPLIQSTESDSEDVPSQIPLRNAKTPPPLPPRNPMLSSPSLAPQDNPPLRSDTIRTTNVNAEDPMSKAKRVENWKKRLTKSRLLLSQHQIEIHTWRVGSDVEDTCKALICDCMEKGSCNKEMRAYI